MYNSEGLFKPLYDNETIQAFQNASDCIKEQYSSFKVAGVHVNGTVTMGENIGKNWIWISRSFFSLKNFYFKADHGGLKIAELAYDNWLRLNEGQEVKLPALDQFTPFQLFYLGYALPWCSVYTEAMLKTRALKDEHAPDKFRVLGPLSNSEKFAETWACSKTAAMNPAEKCQIWG